MFRQLTNLPQDALFHATGRTQLGVFEELWHCPGRGDEDPCFDVRRTRATFNLDPTGFVEYLGELQDWAANEVLRDTYDDYPQFTCEDCEWVGYGAEGFQDPDGSVHDCCPHCGSRNVTARRHS